MTGKKTSVVWNYPHSIATYSNAFSLLKHLHDNLDDFDHREQTAIHAKVSYYADITVDHDHGIRDTAHILGNHAQELLIPRACFADEIARR
jgi:hypothetical protein